jgi:hypothetical protein
LSSTDIDTVFQYDFKKCKKKKYFQRDSANYFQSICLFFHIYENKKIKSKKKSEIKKIEKEKEKEKEKNKRKQKFCEQSG